MKAIKKHIRYILLCSLIILSLSFLAACGAKIDTEMKFDKNFKGERIITATIGSSDLNSYVSTGADGIEETIKNYIPDAMIYKRVDKELGDVEFIFTIAFNDLNEYTKKIEEILNKNSDNTIVPTILYNNKNNEFKKSILFDENFSSSDLLNWLVYGLKTENKISHSTVSDWMENGSSSLKIDNQDYYVYSNFSVKESETTSFDSINVETSILDNGKFKRSITFVADEQTIKTLNNKGIVLTEYLKKLSPESSEFIESKEDNYTKYVVSFESSTSEELAANTAKLFNSQNSVFTVNYSSYSDNKNTIKIDVDEYIDASYYLDYDSNSMTSKLYLYDNVSIDNKNSKNDLYSNIIDDKTCFSYNPNFHDTYKFTFSVPVPFESVELNIETNNNKISEKIVMSVSSNLSSLFKEIIEENIKSSITSEKIVLDTKNDDSITAYTLSYKGKPEDVSKEFENFLSTYTGKNAYHEILYNEVKSKSKFKTLSNLQVNADLSDLAMDVVSFNCKASAARKFEILDSSNIEESDKSTNKNIISTSKSGVINFAALEVGINLVSYIVLIFIIVLVAFILWYLIFYKKSIISSFTSIKEKAKSINISNTFNNIKNNHTKDKELALNSSDEEAFVQKQEESEDEFI